LAKPLVSVVVPCYNVEKKIERFLKSLREQDYRPLEIIFVDDGSTDGTKDILMQFKAEQETADFIVTYVYQSNRGLGGAINTGLKYIKGDYLIWPDPDDWLNPQSISKRVDFLERHPEYAIVTSNAAVYQAGQWDRPVERLVKNVNESTHQENQFELLLRYKSIFCPGCHMIRMRDFLRANPDKDIYESRFGQNFQMLLPIYYYGKRYFMDECLYNYVIYEDSLSHDIKTLEDHYRHYAGYRDIIWHTLERIDMSETERQRYWQIVCDDDIRKHFMLAVNMQARAEMDEYYHLLKEKGGLTKQLRLRYFLGKHQKLKKLAKHIYGVARKYIK